jgi:S1-C subfamily serine protease
VHIGRTAFLGVAIQSASDAAASGVPAGAGASVAGTVPGAPAASAGITQGDVIVSVNGQRISSPEALQSALGQHHPGDSVTIGWQDTTGQTQSATVTLTNGPAA